MTTFTGKNSSSPENVFRNMAAYDPASQPVLRVAQPVKTEISMCMCPVHCNRSRQFPLYIEEKSLKLHANGGRSDGCAD